MTKRLSVQSNIFWTIFLIGSTKHVCVVQRVADVCGAAVFSSALSFSIQTILAFDGIALRFRIQQQNFPVSNNLPPQFFLKVVQAFFINGLGKYWRCVFWSVQFHVSHSSSIKVSCKELSGNELEMFLQNSERSHAEIINQSGAELRYYWPMRSWFLTQFSFRHSHSWDVSRQDYWGRNNIDNMWPGITLTSAGSRQWSYIGWQHLTLLSPPNAALAPQARQARASGENLNYVTLVPQARQARPSGAILNYTC